MEITLTDEQQLAILKLRGWLRFVEADHQLHHEEPLPKDEAIAMQFMGSGASAQVSWGDLRALAAINFAVKP